jgi:quercetin 2,3-dioxygenase
MAAVRQDLEERQVQLAVPRWESESKLDLIPAMKDLGVELLFDDDLADLQNIADVEQLFISDIAHQANITVDEEGTEAAAATAAVAEASSGAAPATLQIDRPFIYLIQNDSTGEILFLGGYWSPDARLDASCHHGIVIKIRRDRDIYETDGGWFHARWHFSFDQYRDPENDSFGAMRVFNDDRLVPGAVWPLHPHRDVEGLTYVVEGLFGHEDNVGGPPGPLPAGSVQRMTLGSGALHSERNASPTEPMRFIQIWILPDTPDLPPGVEQKVFTTDDRMNRLLRVIGPEGGEVVKVHQDASVHVARLDPGVEVSHELADSRGAYVYVIGGAATIDGETLNTGDAAKVTDQPSLTIRANSPSELILVDVPMEFEPVGSWRGRI